VSLLDQEYEDAAHWRATFRDPSYVRVECPVFVRLLKALAVEMKTVKDPEDWADHLGRLVKALPDEDADRLPHELGFIIGLDLSPKAAMRLFTKLGLPEGLLDQAGDDPATVIQLTSFALESRSFPNHTGET